MARAQSPIAKRLKALAQRAGLPVDDRHDGPQGVWQTSVGAPSDEPDTETAAQATTDDEQPTGDFTAVPDPGEQPTGDAPVLSLGESVPQPPAEPEPATASIEEPAPAVEQTSPPADYVVPPIWMDPAPESVAAEPHVIQPPFAEPDPSEVDAAEMFQAGPTLSPPVIPPKPLEPLVDHPVEVSSFPEPTPEPEEVAYAPEPPTLGEPAPSMAAELGDALALTDDDAPAPDPGTTSGPALSPGEDQPTLVNPTLATVPDPEPTAAEAAALPSDPTDEPDPSADAQPTEEPPIEAPVAAGLTGRFAALRKRVRPGAATPADVPVAEAAAPGPEPVSLPDPPAPEPMPGPAPVSLSVGGAVLEQPLAVLPAKPTFAERASLRRRARTLRARRDAGLLELGAIVLDQRRFGDPTAGALQRRRTDELADLDNEISAIEQVIEQDSPSTAVAQLGTVRCSSCTALLGPSDQFCAQCGTPRPDGSLPPGASPSK